MRAYFAQRGKVLAQVEQAAISASDEIADAALRFAGATKAIDESDAGEFFGRSEVALDLLAFFHDRLKVQLRDQGARHDLVDAVLSGEGSSANDDLLLVVKRVEALGRFLATDDGAALLAAAKRAANILRIEEKKDGAYEGTVDAALLEARGLPEEKVLAQALAAAIRDAHEHVQIEDFAGAMAALAALRPAVDAFFDKILVNDPDADLRRNRLNLLARLRAATREVADFARIEG